MGHVGITRRVTATLTTGLSQSHPTQVWEVLLPRECRGSSRMDTDTANKHLAEVDNTRRAKLDLGPRRSQIACMGYEGCIRRVGEVQCWLKGGGDVLETCEDLGRSSLV